MAVIEKACPVCSMTKLDKSTLMSFRGVEYLFCSAQCQDRFREHPNLYVGDPRHGRSEKQKGTSEYKVRRIVLNNKLEKVEQRKLNQKLSELMGVVAVNIGSNEIKVKYDLIQIDLSKVEEVIISEISQTDTKITNSIRRAYIHYIEECEIENLEHLTKDGGYGI
jgi:YHS domain-containing protein